jgi:hypothetical protein
MRGWSVVTERCRRVEANYVFNRTCGDMFRMNRSLSAAGRLTRRCAPGLISWGLCGGSWPFAAMLRSGARASVGGPAIARAGH